MTQDPQIEKSSVCYQLLPKTKENFYKILDYKRQSTKLPLPTQDISNQTIESRVKHFIKDNHLLKQNADESYIIFRSLYDITNETSQKDYRMLFNDMFKHNSFMINKIQEFFHKNEDLEKDQLDRFRSNFGRTIDSLSVLINRLIESTEKIPGLLTHVFHTLSRVSNVQDTEDGIYFHNNIPKQWKLSETTKKYLQEYLEINEFLMHYDVFIPQKEKKEIGFYQYQTEKNYALCFQGLFNFVKQFYQKDYHTIIQKDNFLEEYSNIFNRFNFLFIFCKMIDYIENLKDDESTVSNEAILLFSSLEEQERINKNDSIRLCTRFTFDILIDLLESFIDPLWIFQSENLSDKLSRQREREKQSIIDALKSFEFPFYENNCILEYEDKEITTEVLERVLELNRKYSKQIEGSEEVSRNVVWKLRKMKWNNLFNYGKNNEIDFEFIITEDGSTDDTKKILNDLKNELPMILISHLPLT
mgnify:CR=1 FL=1